MHTEPPPRTECSRAPALLTVAAVCIRDDTGRLLTVRKRATTRFMLPGGKLEPQETPAQAAARETAEELGIITATADLVRLGHWRSPAANEPDTMIDSTVYTCPLRAADPHPAREIEEIRWIDLRRADEYDDLAPMLSLHVIPALLTPERTCALDPDVT